jgi:hypothetical protein
VNTAANKTGRYSITRLRYKAAFDAYWTIASRHSALLKNGDRISQQQRTQQERAAADLKAARDAMNAAASRLDY